jgi:hypothetical protein
MRPLRFVPGRSHLVLGTFLLAMILSGSAYAQDGAVSVGGGDALTIGGLLQTDAYLGRETADGFEVRSTRLRFGGEAESLQYAVQLDFASGSPLLDAFARLPLSEELRVTAGIFKTPFSAEILTSRPDLLFAERARVVNNVAPNRQAGVSLAGSLVPDRLTATVGVFNGTRGLQPQASDPLLYVGRLSGRLPVGTGQLELGTNAAYSIDDDISLPGLGQLTYSGTRVLFGADARLEIDRWLLAGEIDTAWLTPDGAADTTNPFGFYLAGGADVAEAHQVLLRFDQYDHDDPLQASPENQLTVGYNYDPTPMLRVLVNYQAATDDVSDGFVTARLQIALR